MFSTILSIAFVAAILGAAAYFLVKQVHEKPKQGTTGNSDNNIEDTNDTSGNSGSPGN